ncbi:MAG: hypothetical protein A7315_13045 [Candidatus Altiarchaeales archaeon WOR_SM1_79]|nr:MAG: hypothetical protein A7315_13045 [Candidatus Altiarchaeales archaeon WOR_SM1_79]
MKKKILITALVLLISILLINVNADEITPDASTVLLFHFNNDSAFGESNTFAYDFSGNGNNGNINGAVYTTGKYDKGLLFDGANDYVEVANSASLKPTNAITIEAWVNPDTVSTYNTIVSKYYLDGYYLRLENGGIGFSGRGWLGTDPNIVPTGSWSHIVGTYDGTDTKIYLNGQLVNSGQTCSPPPCTLNHVTHPLRIGAWPVTTGLPFDGTIDEVAIYNRALSESEIADHYDSNYINGGAGTVPPTGENKTANVTVNNTPPFIEAKWELYDADDEIEGIQIIVPPLQSVTVIKCAVACDNNSVDNIADVEAYVYYPDGTLMEHEYLQVAPASSVCWETIEDYDDIEHFYSKYENNTCEIYEGNLTLTPSDPEGNYTVIVEVNDGADVYETPFSAMASTELIQGGIVYASSNAIDDNLSAGSTWFASTWGAGAITDWILFDMGTIKSIGGCRIYEGPNHNYNATIYISTDNVTFTEVVTNQDLNIFGQWTYFNWATQDTRYIRVNITYAPTFYPSVTEFDAKLKNGTYGNMTNNFTLIHPNVPPFIEQKWELPDEDEFKKECEGIPLPNACMAYDEYQCDMLMGNGHGCTPVYINGTFMYCSGMPMDYQADPPEPSCKILTEYGKLKCEETIGCWWSEAQIYPDPGENKTVTKCAVVCDHNGLNDISIVEAWTFYPEFQQCEYENWNGCGVCKGDYNCIKECIVMNACDQLKEWEELYPAPASSICRDPNYIEYIDPEYFDKIDAGIPCEIYEGNLTMHFYDEPGYYAVVVKVTDLEGNIDYLQNKFEYLPCISVDNDADFIEFGVVNPGVTLQIPGDLFMSTLDHPTVRNICNVPAGIDIAGTDLSCTTPGTCGTSTIPFSQLTTGFDTGVFNLPIPGTYLSTTGGGLPLLPGPMSTAVENFQLAVPLGTLPGNYQGMVTVAGVAAETICNDLIDNDFDGLTDCFDPDCFGDPACP